MRLWSKPAAAWRTKPSTSSSNIGSGSSHELPKPSLPLFPHPQTQASPFSVTHKECTRPADTEAGVSPSKPSTSLGSSSGFPLPSCWLRFQPHDETTLLVLESDWTLQIAREWSRPRIYSDSPSPSPSSSPIHYAFPQVLCKIHNTWLKRVHIIPQNLLHLQFQFSNLWPLKSMKLVSVSILCASKQPVPGPPSFLDTFQARHIFNEMSWEKHRFLERFGFRVL